MTPDQEPTTGPSPAPVRDGSPTGTLAIPDSGAEGLVSRRIRSSVALLGLVVVVAAAAAAGGWWLGSRVKSPEQLAAESAPPPPSLITAPVEFRELTDRIVVRGTLVAPVVTEFTVRAPADGEPVVTRLPLRPGDQLAEGDVVLEVSGRPVFVLSGSVPSYRDLTAGVEGRDVVQLQEALVRLGYDPGDVDGVYGASTQEAVGALYRDAGYDPQTADLSDAIDAARDRVDAAARTVRDAETAVGAAKAGTPAALAQAEADLAAARRAYDGAIAKADLDATEHAAVVDSAQRAYDAVLADPDATAADIDDAYLALVAAQNSAERSRLDNEEAIASAEDRITVAELALEEAKNPPDLTPVTNALDDARHELADAKADLAELVASTGVVVPRSEYVIVATLPAQLSTADAALGAAPGTPTFTMLTGAPITRTLLTGPELQLVEVGDPVLIESTTAGLSVEAHIAEIATDSTTDEAGLTGFETTIASEGEPLPLDLAGSDVQLTITAVTAAEPVLVVPIAAIIAQGDGTPRITVIDPDGTDTDVTVTVGRIAGGYAEITPDDYQLGPGDRVRIAAPR